MNRLQKHVQLIESAAESSQDSIDFPLAVTSHSSTPSSPSCLNRDDVLAILGYRSAKQPKTTAPSFTSFSGQKSDICHRCGKKVYPLERIDIGDVYHRGCFKCQECGLQLTLKTFSRAKNTLPDADTNQKEIYCHRHLPRPVAGSFGGDAIGIKTALDAQKHSVNKLIRPYEQSPMKYDAEALEFQHVRQLNKQQKVRRRSSLKTYKDFKKFGVFDAQENLEKKHRSEEDELYQQMLEERQKQMKELEKSLVAEREKNVRELIDWFEQKGMSQEECSSGLKKLERFYAERREERIKQLLEKMAIEEQAAVTRLIERHAQEMLFMIQEKENEAESLLISENQDEMSKQWNQESKYMQQEEHADDTPQADEEPYDLSSQTKILSKNEDVDETEELQPQMESGKKISTQLESLSDSWEDVCTNEPRVVIVRETVTNIPVNRLTVLPLQQVKTRQKTYQQDAESQGELLKMNKSKHEKRQLTTDIETQTDVDQRRTKKSHCNVSTNKHSERDLSQDAKQGSDEVRKKAMESAQYEESKSAIDMKRHQVPERLRQHFQVTISMENIPAEQEYDSTDSDFEDLHGYTQQPEICPPSCCKSELYKSADVFKDFDRRAIKEAQNDPSSFTDLVRRLSRKCETELHRVRAIFRWITAKDLNKIEFSEALDTESPMGLLRGIKFGTETYHNLFKRLCSYAGLHCEIIEGYSKGAGYQPGSHFHGNQFRNQWTAVWVDGSWRFVNCNWGARHVKKPGDEEMTYHIDEFYFLTDPEEHIYQHFPDEPRWQLLQNELKLDEFVSLPLVKSPFFNHHLEFAIQTQAIIRSSDGMVDVRLVAPKLLNVAAKLRSKDDVNVQLQDRCLVRTIDNMVVISAVLPAPGRYYLDVFVGEDWQRDSLDSAFSLRIHCKSVASHIAELSFPPAVCFGRTPDCTHYGILKTSPVDPLIVVNGHVVLKLKISSTDDIRLSHTLRLWKNGSLHDADRFALLKSYINGSAKWSISCPRTGLYALSIMAGISDENPPRCVYRYLIDCQQPLADARPMPRATTRWHNCRLIEPLNGELPARSRVQFRIESTAAKELLVNTNKTWTALVRSGDVWQAMVETCDTVGVDGKCHLQVYGRFDAASDKYIPLLDYSVREPSYTDEVRTLLRYL